MASTEVLTDLYASLHLLESRIRKLEESMELNAELNVKDTTEFIEDVAEELLLRILKGSLFTLQIKE